MIAIRQVIQTKEIVGTISILLVGNNIIELHNITLASGYNSNLIYLANFIKAESHTTIIQR